MRWLVLLVVLGTWAPERAGAIVIMSPPIVRACPSPSSWAEIASCLAKHGIKTRPVRALPTAKLLAVQDGNTDRTLVVFVQEGAKWHLGGLLELDTEDYEVFAFDTLVANRHTGYRVDVGQIQASGVSLDGTTTRPALRRTRSSIYCSGASYWCTQVTTACDVMIDGKTYSTFRGEVTIQNNEVVVSGDRAVARECTATEHQPLGWPAP